MEDFHILGISHVSNIRAQDNGVLDNDRCKEYKMKLDPCVLYTFRCAVYYAENEKHGPDLLSWWNWKNTALQKI